MNSILFEDRFELLAQNQRGHYPIDRIGVELGIWEGVYQGVELPWLRWWDAEGNLLLAAEEIAEQERIAKEKAQSEAEQERIAKEKAQLEAEQERQRRIEAEQRLQALEARLRELEGS